MRNETLHRLEAKQFELEYKLDSIIGFFGIPLKDQIITITDSAVTITIMNKNKTRKQNAKQRR